MSSIQGLPMQGSDVTAVITRVHLHPLCVLVEFWAKFSQQSKADYQHIASNIQSPGAVFKELEGNPGDQCLVKIDDTWHRSRIVSRNGFNYQVFLIDKGITCSATTSMLAWGKKEYFQVPPEVEFCVLANVLPRAQEKRWSPMAQEYLKSFTGKSVAAHVQDILVSHKIFLLHIPSISTQMYEMGFARKLSPAMFLDFVLLTLKSPSGGEAPLETMQLFGEAIHGQQKQELFVYPELSVENTTAVTVTEVISPKRIFCQLKIFSKELKRLSEKLTQSCEGRRVRCILCPEMIGCPYAAKGNDGQWYRSVVQQLFPTNALVEVLNVDYGTKQFVPVENIRELPAEFFRMPVFTYSCSLHGITDKGSGWEVRQINFLRSLLLHKTVSAHFQYHVISEGVYSVTLYGDHNTNLNKLFGSREGCLLEGDKTVARYSIQSITSTKQHLTPETTRENHVRNGDECFLLDNLPLNSSHLAVVHHVISPSEFWIQTETYRKELDKLLDNICHLHKGSVNTDVKHLTVGLYCVAKAKDDNFYRVSVCEVGNAKVKVFFVDYGNTEVVDKNDIRSLPPEFKELPKLALKCTLASVGPTDGRWNDSATEFFTKVVIDKLLNIQVKAKNADGYVVQLTDPNAQSEQDVGRLMCNFGHAEWLEVIQPSVVMPPAHVNGNLPACRDDKVQPQTKGGFGIKEAPLFKARMFSIGSVLEVTVSYIESPNDFWCQLVQNMKHLQLLMGDLQYHYANSEFQHDAETSCVAQHPSNGMWYRALVVRRHKTPHVDVLFVDYGHTETVSISALRKISPEFLTLDGQAFRCSLLNLTDPTTLVNNWKEEAKAKFLNFVKTAASNFGILKCTVYAVMYNKQRTLYNVVDLETPFESICTIMANLVSSPPPQKPNGQSASLCTYYYSTHNIKVGTEEQVTVTCVDSVNHFYCHLDKNQDVIKELSMKLNSLCNQLLKVKFPKVFASLCFAKYTDGQWYRAQIKQTKPALLVHFVDYGDTIEVDKSDLIPIPKEANDILSVPIQAVLCGLADVPPDVSSEADQWFASAVAGCKFKGLVVAKEPDGKLLVELYHGNSQINFDIKNMFLNKAQKKQQSHKDFQPPEEQTLRTARGFSEQAASKSSFSVCAGVLGSNRSSVNLKSSEKNENGFCDSMKKMRRAPSELYKPPHQRTSNNTKPDTASKNAEVSGNQRSDDLSPETKFVLSEWSRTESQQEVDGGKVPQLPELPPSRITAGMRVDVYVSHYNSPLSFYVQRIDEEEELFSLVEQLNDPEWTQKDSPIQDVHVGDLVLAEFSEDSSWYRAVVKEIQEEHTALIEFVDFGNTAEAPVSNMRRLQQSFLQLPAYSTHCMLGDAEGLGLRMLDPEVVSLFREDLGVGGEKVLRCCFIKRVGSVWEVSLEDGGVAVGCKVPDVVTEEHKEEEEPTNIPAVTQEAEISEKSPVSVCSPHKEQECTEEQQLEEFIPTMKEKSLSGDSGVEEKTSGGKSPPPVDAPESECFDSSPYVVNDPETKVCDIEEKETSTCYLESENFTEPIQEKNEEDERITSVPSLTASRAVHMIPRKADLETLDPVLDVPKQLSFDSGVEEKPVQTEETSSPPVDAPESESLDLSQEKIGDDIDEPETRIEEKEASPCSSEMKSFSEPGEEKHEQEASEWRSFGKTSTAVQMVPQGFVIEEIKDPNVPEQDDESRGASTCVEESCPADFCTADLKDESPDGETLSQGSDDHLSAAAEEETSAVTFPCEAVGPEVKGGGDYIHDKLEKKESSGSSEESEEVHQDDASSLSVEDVFTGQEKSISGDECSGVQLSLTSMCMEDITAEVLPAEKLPEK